MCRKVFNEINATTAYGSLISENNKAKSRL